MRQTARRGARGVILAMLLAAGTAPGLQAQRATSAAVEDSIRALEAARGEALLHADTAALSRMVAADFVEVSRLGTLRTKADNIRDIQSGDLRLRTIRNGSQTVRVYGDVAVLIGIADNTGTFRGFPFRGKIRYTRLFARRDGRWQAVAMQQTAMQWSAGCPASVVLAERRLPHRVGRSASGHLRGFPAAS